MNFRVRKNDPRIYLLVFFSLVNIHFLWGQDSFTWRIAHENWTGQDKVIHLTGNYLLCAALHSKMSLPKAMYFTSLTGLLWEIKDSWLPWQHYGFIGSEGFSYTDFWVGNAGILFYAVSQWLYQRMKSYKQPARKNIKRIEMVLATSNSPYLKLSFVRILIHIKFFGI